MTTTPPPTTPTPPLHEKKWAALRQHILPHVVTVGWHEDALLRAVDSATQQTLRALFPQGIRDMLTCLNNEHLALFAEQLRAHPLKGAKAVIQAALLHKAQILRDNQALAHKTTSYLSGHPNLARDLSGETINQFWQWAGDTTTPKQFAYHTKRLTLTYAYGATLLYAQTSPPPEDSALKAFIDRRLDDIAQGGQFARSLQRFTSTSSPTKH